MTIKVRKMIVPEDYEAIAVIMTGHYSEEVTVEKMREEDEIIPLEGSLGRDEEGRLIGHDRLRLIALSKDGCIVGYAHAWRAPWSPPGVLFEQIIVDRKERKSGAGSALYEALIEYSTGVGAGKIVADVRDDDPESVRFACARGFAEGRHLFESVIELESDRDADQGTQVDFGFADAQLGEIRLLSLADLSGEETEIEIYNLYFATHADIPGFEGEFMWYSEWRKRTVDRDDFDRSLLLVAMVGETIVGAVELRTFETTQSVYNEFTCVAPVYRGRGIAMALKKLSIDIARKRGFRYIRTNNDSLNGPMLAINRKLGYKPVPGYFQMVSVLPDPL
ncbi:GNAT family N-acetyltransferase [Paenibacillus harenae]|uniref:GNAT superfamily N-acetyltransferase n=1 Tax=Paenibacillus harenae TaxID=306543 RepID=A0ABT9TXE6_PAEHA|nr:GNAT family N-acetyltransferase [Paenibacillus harenae]MDQ0110709.1 GNAT superfamily N-acetyltransferase [Paenibacillus harenae]